MGKTEKLIAKLQNGTIKADELRVLLKRLGYSLANTKGSHEQWVNLDASYPRSHFTLATHSQELKPYQVKEAQKKLLAKD